MLRTGTGAVACAGCCTALAARAAGVPSSVCRGPCTWVPARLPRGHTFYKVK